jgi:hypothetical protein
MEKIISTIKMKQLPRFELATSTPKGKPTPS